MSEKKRVFLTHSSGPDPDISAKSTVEFSRKSPPQSIAIAICNSFGLSSKIFGPRLTYLSQSGDIVDVAIDGESLEDRFHYQVRFVQLQGPGAVSSSRHNIPREIMLPKQSPMVSPSPRPHGIPPDYSPLVLKRRKDSTETAMITRLRELPTGVLDLVFSHFPLDTVTKFSLVCSRWLKVARAHVTNNLCAGSIWLSGDFAKIETPIRYLCAQTGGGPTNLVLTDCSFLMDKTLTSLVQDGLLSRVTHLELHNASKVSSETISQTIRNCGPLIRLVLSHCRLRISFFSALYDCHRSTLASLTIDNCEFADRMDMVQTLAPALPGGGGAAQQQQHPDEFVKMLTSTLSTYEPQLEQFPGFPLWRNPRIANRIAAAARAAGGDGGSPTQGPPPAPDGFLAIQRLVVCNSHSKQDLSDLIPLVLITNSPNLTHLDVQIEAGSGPMFDRQPENLLCGGDFLQKVLLNSDRPPANLRTLKICGSFIGQSVRLLSYFLQLERLELSHCSFKDGISYISKCKKLKYLRLKGLRTPPDTLADDIAALRARGTEVEVSAHTAASTVNPADCLYPESPFSRRRGF